MSKSRKTNPAHAARMSELEPQQKPKKKRKRNESLHVMMTVDEHAEVMNAANAHGMLAREVVLKAIRHLESDRDRHLGPQVRELRDQFAKLVVEVGKIGQAIQRNTTVVRHANGED